MVKPFATFDVDGTIFKSSLVEKVVEGCIEDGMFDAEAFNAVRYNRQRWQKDNNEGTYQAYLHRLVGAFVDQMQDVEVERFDAVTNKVLSEHRVRKFAFPRLLLNAIAGSHQPIVVSGSPDILVRPFLEDIGITEIYGSKFEIEDGFFTGHANGVGDKAEVLRRLVNEGLVKREHSIAVGILWEIQPFCIIAITQ